MGSKANRVVCRSGQDSRSRTIIRPLFQLGGWQMHRGLVTPSNHHCWCMSLPHDQSLFSLVYRLKPQCPTPVYQFADQHNVTVVRGFSTVFAWHGGWTTVYNFPFYQPSTDLTAGNSLAHFSACWSKYPWATSASTLLGPCFSMSSKMQRARWWCLGGYKCTKAVAKATLNALRTL